LCIVELWQAIQAICKRLTGEEMGKIHFHLGEVSKIVFSATGEQEQAEAIETNDQYLMKWCNRIND